MPRVDRDIVSVRLERMLNEVDEIERKLPGRVKDYTRGSAEDLRYELEHRLYIALLAVLDTAAHFAVIGDQPADSYRDAIMAMQRLGVMDGELAERLARAAGLRNALVHDYLEVDNALVYAAMRDLGDLRRFAEQVWRWVLEQSPR